MVAKSLPYIEHHEESEEENELKKYFSNQHKFSLMIEDLSKELELDYVDTICHYCEVNDIEIEQAAKMLNQTLKDKLRREFTDKRQMLKGVAKLKPKNNDIA